jgi:hypothetical protein
MVRACEKQLSHQHCHDKIAFCWHSWAAPKVAPLQDFYPGDDLVDWIGISIFQQLYPWANAETIADFAGGSLDQVQEVLEFAKQHDKPIMIAESTPFGGIDLGDMTMVTNNTTITDTDIWKLWFQPTLDLIGDYDIAMWSYINCDWNAQPMWKGVGFGDTLLSSSSEVMTYWWEKVLQEDRFLNQLDCHHHNHDHRHKHESSSAEGAPVMAIFDWRNDPLSKSLLHLSFIGAAVVVIAFSITRNRTRNRRQYLELQSADL